MDQFQGITELNIHLSCRTCLENINEMHHNLFAIPDLGKKFTICTALPIEPGDGYPKSVCESCRTKIDDFYNFQQMCISARKRFEDYINSKEKPCKSELDVDSNKLSTDLIMFMEPKEEKEENSLSNLDCSEFLQAELTNVNKQDDSSSEDNGEESDDDQPIAKYRVLNKDISDKDRNSTLFDNKNNTHQDKTAGKKVANPSLSKKKLECEICKKRFMKLKTFHQHMRAHQEVKPFPCQQCDKSYTRPGPLKVHIRSKHKGKPFLCTGSGCGKSFYTKQTLRQHFVEVHCDTNTKGFETQQLYICEVCGKVLKGSGTLKNHRYLHTGEPRPHECLQCHKRYMTGWKLRVHMNRHAGIKNFVCPYCGAKKSSQSELKNHLNYHTKEKQYPCNSCNMVFNNSVNYSRHRRVVHQGIKNFHCSYCDKSFGKSETRKHHEMTHTGEKPHECSICDKKFIQIVALRKHQKVHLKAQKIGL